MRILLLGKFPPIQGGVSAQTYTTALELARQGHIVDVVTNSSEVELSCRQLLTKDDQQYLKVEGMVVHYTEPLLDFSYIPWANPYSSKLFGICASLLSEYQFDLIVGWYFEPYGLCAAQLSSIFSVPLLLRHAGSDLGRLAQHPNLYSAYSWMLKQADGIVTSRMNSESLSALKSLGAYECKFLPLRASRLAPHFTKGPSFLSEEILGAAKRRYHQYSLPKKVIHEISRTIKPPFESPKITIGMYGKVGTSKGSYCLIEALDRLAQEGSDFNLILLSGGSRQRVSHFLHNMCERTALLERSLILPFLPHWRVFSFLKQCDVVCFLENDFPISAHRPQIPREILASEACFVCSSEIAEKQSFRDSLVDGKNYVRVEDPNDTAVLASKLRDLITNPEKTKVIGKHGGYLFEAWEDEIPEMDAMAQCIVGCEHLLNTSNISTL